MSDEDKKDEILTDEERLELAKKRRDDAVAKVRAAGTQEEVDKWNVEIDAAKQAIADIVADMSRDRDDSFEKTVNFHVKLTPLGHKVASKIDPPNYLNLLLGF